MSHYSKPQFGEIIIKTETLCEDLLTSSTVMFLKTCNFKNRGRDENSYKKLFAEKIYYIIVYLHIQHHQQFQHPNFPNLYT